MTTVSPKITEAIATKPADQIWISLEFFPPRTDKGVDTLYNVIGNKLKNLNPIFTDFTWGAGGSTSDLTLDLCVQVKSRYGLNPNMHLTCTNMEKQKVINALAGCKTAGITNIVALRGDPPAGQEAWEAVEGGFTCALDLVRFIKAEHGDTFCLSVAGYPEGHPNNMTAVDDVSSLSEAELGRMATFVEEDGTTVRSVCRDDAYEIELNYLKEKVDAGASTIITQLFFDNAVFLTFVRDCRAKGITVPIIPGIMCISSKGGFKRMTKFCKTRVPKVLSMELDAAEDDEAAKAIGIRYGTEMCRELIASGIDGLHFYTLNLRNVTVGIIDSLKESGVQLFTPGQQTVFDGLLGGSA
ncbi:MTHFR1 [Symbiodinium microadriaticum]|nr:MTHFR1 [Symbiodinium microadriaticum]